jgi:hypothetical protein
MKDRLKQAELLVFNHGQTLEGYKRLDREVETTKNTANSLKSQV